MADNLLDKASILLTPTAYNDGRMLSVKPENGDGDFTFSRSSAATRVNAQGLVENVQIISPELVSNGNFSQIGTEEVSNGNFSQEGSEVSSDVGFDNPSNWTLTGQSSVSNGKAHIVQDNTSNTGVIANTTITNKTYKITGVVSDYVSGSVGFSSIGSTTPRELIPTQNGEFTIYYTSTRSTPSSWNIQRISSPCNLKIDNVSVKEVGQDWSLGSGWSIGDGIVEANNTSSFISQSGLIEASKLYRLTFEARLKSGTNGTINAYIGGSNNKQFTIANTDWQSFTYENTRGGSSADSIYFNNNGTELELDNISVKEVGQDWTFGTGWSVDQANSKVVGDGTSFTYITQSPISIQNKKVKLTFDISDYVSGTFRLLPSDRQDGLDERFSGNGSYEVVYISTLDTFRFQQQAFNGSITNISVKEITDDTDLPRINYEGFSYQDSLGSELIVNGDFSNGSANWFDPDGAATFSNNSVTISGASGNRRINQTNVTSPITSQFKLQYEITEKVGTSDLKVYTTNSGSAAYTIVPSTIGVHTFYFTSNLTTFYFNFSNSSGSITIDNVSVKEYLGQEVVPDSGCGSWLLEPQSTNMVAYSEDFSNITDYALTVTDNSTISPENINNGTSLVPSTVNTVHYLTFPNTSTGTVTFTVYAKANGYNYIFLHLYDGSNGRAWFNLDTGVVGTKDSSVTSEMIAMTNGWYRCSVTRVLSGSLIQADIAVSNADNATTFSGNGTSGIFIYGAQLEQQSYATSYIPTNGATNTRLQDIANNSGNSTLINSTEGVLYAEIAALADGTNQRWISIGSGSNADRVSILFNATNRISCSVRGSSTAIYDANHNIGSQTNNSKVAIRYKDSDFAFFVNGVKVNSQTSGTLNFNAALDTLSFDSADGGSKFIGKAKALAVYKEALTDAELQSLTTI